MTRRPRSTARRAPRSSCRGCLLVASEPMTKPMSKPMTVGHGPAPGSACKCTPNSPAAYATTPPPRCDELGWSHSPWGWLSISRQNPVPEAGSHEEVGVLQEQSEDKKKQQQQQDEARNRGLRLRECARRAQVIASAIGERFALGGSDSEAVKAGVSGRGGGRGREECAGWRRVIASAIRARVACLCDVGASVAQTVRRR